jgi:hypothetical protein
LRGTENEENGMDNYDWLQAIDDHPHLTTEEDLVGAYAFLGTKTDRTEEQVSESVFTLQLLGFLEVVGISDDDRTYTYELRMPDKVAA